MPTLFFVLVSVFLVSVKGLTPPPGHSLGQPWPMPKTFSQTGDMQMLSQDTFQFTVTGNDCDILQAAVTRYFKIIFYTGWQQNPQKPKTSKEHGEDNTLRFHPRFQHKTGGRVPRSVGDAPLLSTLSVSLSSPCEMWPSLQMDESCKCK